MLGVNLQGPGCCVAKCFHDHSQGCCPEGLNMSRQVSYVTGHWPPSDLLRPSLASSICDSVTSMLIPKPLLLPDFHLVQTPAAPAEVVQLEAAPFKSKSATPFRAISNLCHCKWAAFSWWGCRYWKRCRADLVVRTSNQVARYSH